MAVPSQAAALRAWGTHRNLFATGHAKVATDEAAISAALQHPGTLLRRAVGSNDPFSIEPTSLPKVPDWAAAMPESPSVSEATQKPELKRKLEQITQNSYNLYRLGTGLPRRILFEEMGVVYSAKSQVPCRIAGEFSIRAATCGGKSGG